MEVSLAGKVAIVTGAASGIGKAVVESYLGSGAAGVIAVDRSADFEKTMAPIAQQYYGQLFCVNGDVSAEQTAVAYTATAVNHFDSIDVLVSNAAVSVVKPLHLHTPEEWDAVMNVNVRSLYWAARHVIPKMMEQATGLILVSGSISGCAGIPTQGAYAPSKGALHQMVRQMAVEYAAHGIRVNAVACGTVDTPIVHQSAAASGNAESYWAMLRDAHPVGRIADVREVADFFTYLASDRASFFTGSILMMDGGYTAR